MLHHGDCLDVMAAMDPESVDAIVTDPPYNIGFMGKAWDTGHGHGPWAEAAYRVAKPSSYLLAFGGTRTVHRMTVALEDAGWIIRDMLVWGYASGFPKSKASLKPAWEPIVMARKPGPLRMLAIDECRIEVEPTKGDGWRPNVSGQENRYNHGTPIYGAGNGLGLPVYTSEQHPLGRWPANIVLTDPIFDGGIEGVVGGGEARPGGNIVSAAVTGYGGHWADDRTFAGYTDEGTYSRFFLIPKAARSDREPVLYEGDARANVHPTVKPVDLMRHLVRLVTPTGGCVLDPFLGSGTTALAAEMEGFEWIGIEREAEYVAIADARLNGTQRGMAL